MDLKRPNSSEVVGTNINNLTVIGSLGTTQQATDASEAVNKNQVDNKLLTKINKSGDTITTPITLANNPQQGSDASTFQHMSENLIPMTLPAINAQLDTKLNKTGDTITGQLNVSVVATNNFGVVTKAQAESAIDAINPSNTSGVDTGAILVCYDNLGTPDYLRANGAQVSTATYNNLYMALGGTTTNPPATFTIPDLSTYEQYGQKYFIKT